MKNIIGTISSCYKHITKTKTFWWLEKKVDLELSLRELKIMIFRVEKLKHTLLKNVPQGSTFSQFNNLRWILLVIWVNEWILLNWYFLGSFWSESTQDARKIKKNGHFCLSSIPLFIDFKAEKIVCIQCNSKDIYQNSLVYSNYQ